jgi:hypothetical protein
VVNRLACSRPNLDGADPTVLLQRHRNGEVLQVDRTLGGDLGACRLARVARFAQHAPSVTLLHPSMDSRHPPKTPFQ